MEWQCTFQRNKCLFKDVESQTYKIQYRVLLAKYRGRTACRRLSRDTLRSDAEYVKVGNKTIGVLLQNDNKTIARAFFLN